MNPEEGMIQTAQYFAAKIYELATAGLDDTVPVTPEGDTELQDACTDLAVSIIATLHQNGAVMPSKN